MTDGLLKNIIELEKQLQAEVADEQVRAQRWQEHELEQLEDFAREAKSLEKERLTAAIAEREEELKHEVATLEANAEAWSRRLLSLEDAILIDVLKQQLADILPGGDHDHPHGES